VPSNRYSISAAFLLSLGLGSYAARAQTVQLTAATTIISENAGTVSLALSIQNPGATAVTVEVALVPGLSTTTAGQDFTYAATQTVTFPAGATGNQTVTIPLTDDALAEPTEYFTVRLQNPANATLGGTSTALVYIRDNDTPAPVSARNLTMTYLGSYQNGAAGTNSSEIVSYDPTTKRLYVVNSVGGKLDVLDFTNPAAPTSVASIDIKPYGNINSVAVHNGVVAAAMENANPQQNGSVVFFDQNGAFQQQVTAGALPDMVTFSPDGRYVLTANEGEPNATYASDPEGSVSIVDVSGGVGGLTQANVTTVGFTSYNSQAAALRSQGIRIFGGTAVPSSVAQDLEPEYVAVSADSRTAYITLQENNAVAVLDLTTKQFTALRPLGYQDHQQAGFSLDASDQSGEILLANWPIKGMRQPDAIAAFAVGGQEYYVTANEGDAREYGTALVEPVRLGNNAYPLDPTAFPNAAILKNNNVLGRLNVTNKLGDTDGDGDFDEIYAFGGRSFSIFNASTGALVHDSGDLLERVTSTDPTYGPIFNASNSATEAPTRKNRSDDKGPEPEGVTTATMGGNTYVFVSMERVGGVMAFNVNNPANPVLEQYVNHRSLTASTGDQGPEGIVFISAANSPTGQELLVLANEVSSTVSVYQVQTGATLASQLGRTAEPLALYPNPAQGGRVHLSRPVSGTLTDAVGRPVQTLTRAAHLETAGLAPGLYVLRTTEGTSSKLVVR